MKRHAPETRNRYRPVLEELEDRTVLSPTVLDPNLEVLTVASFLPTAQPTSMAFLQTDNANDILVLEKQTGIVQRVISNVKVPVLDLAVNNAGERGLLGMALHPNFHDADPATPRFVYLYWTESTAVNAAGDLVDSSNANSTPLLGNRVDRFVWDGSSLTFDQNIIQLRAWQPPNPGFETGNFTNHNGGVIRFGPDGKLYVFIGDNGRRGFMQNIQSAPHLSSQGGRDDQFGGPMPDDAHLTGVTLRLNDDGTTPTDNPFFEAGAEIAVINPEVGANVQKIFAYGHRNSFGLAFDPFTGNLWNEENGDNSFTELNLVEAGMNGGWIMVAGPLSRINEFKTIETTGTTRGLQQTRFSPDDLPNTADEALTRMYKLPGSHYSDPEFSWKFEVAPAAIGFLNSQPDDSPLKKYEGNLFTGAARNFLAGGQIFRFQLNEARNGFVFDDPRLDDLVADNRFTSSGATAGRYDITESESLLFGINFGVGTDIQTGPDGNLYVVSLSDGAVYRIQPREVAPTGTAFTAILTGDQEVPRRATSGLAIAQFTLSEDMTRLSYTIYIFGLDLGPAAGLPQQTPDMQDNIGGLHIHRGAPGVNGPIVFGMINPDNDLDGPFISTTPGVVGGTVTGDWDLTEGNMGATLSSELENLLNGNLYLNIHTTRFPGGEIRGQIRRA